MKYIIIVLIHLIPIKAHASELHQNVLLELLANAAFMESQVAEKLGEPGKTHQAQIQEAYRSLKIAYLYMTRVLENNPNDLEPGAVAYTYGRMGWFLHLSHLQDNDLLLDASELVGKAHKIEPENSTYLYQIAMLSDDYSRLNFLEKSLKLNPQCPEAILELLGLKMKLKIIDPSSIEADALRDDFIKNLANFNPELFFFDSGYPAKNARIKIHSDQGFVERLIYRPEIARFRWHYKKENE